jgi:WD40 repeat protein
MLPPLRGRDHAILSVTVSPDGSKVISGSFDRTIRAWDASIGVEMLPPLRGHDDWIYSVAFSPDGSKIISGSQDKTIRVRNATTGAEMLPPLRGRDDVVLSVAFSPDGSKIISGSWDKTIRVWDASTGTEMLPLLRDNDNHINFVAFSPDGSEIISRSIDAEIIQIRDASTGIVLPPPQISDGDIPRDEPTIGGWLTNINTGRYMGALPVSVNFHSGHFHSSTYVGWTAVHKLVLVHFPEQLMLQ